MNYFLNMLEAMNEAELKTLSSMVYHEQRRRAEQQLQSGNYSPLTQNEIEIFAHGGKLECIRAYKDRTGCDLYLAKEVVEKHFQ